MVVIGTCLRSHTGKVMEREMRPLVCRAPESTAAWRLHHPATLPVSTGNFSAAPDLGVQLHTLSPACPQVAATAALLVPG